MNKLFCDLFLVGVLASCSVTAVVRPEKVAEMSVEELTTVSGGDLCKAYGKYSDNQLISFEISRRELMSAFDKELLNSWKFEKGMGVCVLNVMGCKNVFNMTFKSEIGESRVDQYICPAFPEHLMPKSFTIVDDHFKYREYNLGLLDGLVREIGRVSKNSRLFVSSGTEPNLNALAKEAREKVQLECPVGESAFFNSLSGCN